MIVLDTNVVFEPLKRSPNERVHRWAIAHRGQTAITSITVGEMVYGAHRVASTTRRNKFLDWLDPYFAEMSAAGLLYRYGHDAAIEFGSLRAASEHAGRPRPHPDLMIAAICRVHGAAIATRNVKDFEGLGIEVIDPWAG